MRVVTFYSAFYASQGPLLQENYFDMIKMLEKSCLRLGIKFTVITDVVTAAGLNVPEPFIVKTQEHLMRATISGQIDYLNSARFDEDTIFVDADVLIMRLPEAIWLRDFDLALTVRRWSDMDAAPINNGVMLCKVRSRWECISFFESALARCGTEWGADQAAIGDCCRPMPPEGAIVPRKGARVLLMGLDCYNYAPRGVGDRNARNAFILHFRGPRKSYMKDYADALT